MLPGEAFNEDDKLFLDEVSKENFKRKGCCTVPELRYQMMVYQDKCEEILKRLLQSNDCAKEIYLAILLVQFWNTKQYHLFCEVGKYLSEKTNVIASHDCSEKVKDALDGWKEVGENARACYDWSCAEESKVAKGMRTSIQKQRPSGTPEFSENEISTCAFNDQHGICRVHMAIANPKNSKIDPKVFIAVVGTRNASWWGVVKEWLFTNLCAWPTQSDDYGTVHYGFNNVANHLQKEIFNKIEDSIGSEKDVKVEVSIVGHSMGAAVGSLLALNIAKEKWCKSCVGNMLATPAAFGEVVVLPVKVALTSFVDMADPVNYVTFGYKRIGDTFMLKSRLWGWQAHTTSYDLFFEDLTFEKGVEWIVYPTPSMFKYCCSLRNCCGEREVNDAGG